MRNRYRAGLGLSWQNRHASSPGRVAGRLALPFALAAALSWLFFANCSDDSGPTQSEIPACRISATSLDFDSVQVGNSAERTFTITNTGGGLLSGSVFETCSDFNVVEGAIYDLSAGAADTVTIRFQPSSPGDKECTLSTGNDLCGGIELFGSAFEPGAACDLSAETIDFGEVAVGQEVERTFSITNTGGGTLTGTVRSPCTGVTILSGGSYNLSAGQSRAVAVRFRPESAGALACTLDTGNAFCRPVIANGTAVEPLPFCALSPSSLDFGDVAVGQPADRSFTIRNDGGGTLSGTVTSCTDFLVVSGASYSLGPGESQTITVRFTPPAAGAAACTLQIGGGCGEYVARGNGISSGPLCLISDTILDFGNVNVGQSADRDFTITNNGDGVLAGTMAETCPDFSIVSGGTYSLSAGQNQTVTVRFGPSIGGNLLCTIDPGSPRCIAIQAEGIGVEQPAVCELSGPLNFGEVAVGQSADLSFTITNTGGGLLAGTFTEECTDFFIVSSPIYSLGRNENQTIVVRFSPSSVGFQSCTLQSGNTLCAGLSASGTGGAEPACALSTPAIDFGTLPVGQFADSSFTITNTGGGTVSGTITGACGDFSIVSGADYSLGAGQSQTVVVRFAPTASGSAACTLETGSAACSDLQATGTGALTTGCRVSPTALDFGTVTVGGSVQRAFTIVNPGEQALAGTVTESCPDFTILSAASYEIASGDSVTWTVQFSPTSPGTQDCTIDTGNALCPEVAATGLGAAVTPQCLVSADSLDFGGVQVGETADLDFTIANTGSGVLSGTVTLPAVPDCAGFSIVSGAAYSLAAEEEQIVTVRFNPTATGARSCLLNTGNDLCGEVVLAGTGLEPPPECLVSVSSLDFGSVAVGQATDRTFRLTNTGGGTLSGTVSESCPDFLIVSGADYALGPDQGQTFTVRFQPATAGPAGCTFETGNALCGDVTATGTGVNVTPACSISDTVLDFGQVTIGQVRTLSFTITNTGGGTLTGTISENCADISITSPPTYNLTAGQAHTVQVRFSPSAAGPFSCMVETGSTFCADVGVIGSGVEPPPVCAVSTPTLDFGSVLIGESTDRSFTITNTGGGTLTGTVSEACGPYSIVSGGAYSLTAGQVATVTVRFTPGAAGPAPCTIDTGNAGCADVTAAGSGVAPPACEISVTGLDFGEVLVGESADRSFTISNTGGGVLEGTVSETCADFSIVSGEAYSLAGGQRDTVVVRFTPGAAGPAECVIDTGNPTCADITATGVGVEPPACAVSADTLAFGDVVVGESADLQFTITNTGGGVLAGTVSENCNDFSIMSGETYSLTGGQIDTVVVRFNPGATGPMECALDTGNAGCPDVILSGGGLPHVEQIDAFKDVTVRSGMPSYNGCAALYDSVGIDRRAPGDFITLLQFDLSSLPSCAVVSDVELDIYGDGCDPSPQLGTVHVGLEQVLQDWAECEVTWATAPDTDAVSGCVRQLECDPPGYLPMTCGNLITLVQGWIDSPAGNHGIAIAPESEFDGALAIRSHRYGATPPRLIVTYTCPPPLRAPK